MWACFDDCEVCNLVEGIISVVSILSLPPCHVIAIEYYLVFCPNFVTFIFLSHFDLTPLPILPVQVPRHEVHGLMHMVHVGRLYVYSTSVMLFS